MLIIKTLLPELKKLVTDLSEDLLARSTAKDDPYSAKVDAGLREAYTQIEKGGRTAQAFEVWREDYLDQVAVAWVLGCVFVRFMEDNHLIDECWLAGEGDRRKLAEDTHELYFREHPHESDREYFEHVFHEVGKIPACRDLFAEGKTPLWAVGPSGDAAMKLLAFWRDVVPETGELSRSFEVEDGDTRFLGDLYQDLSERARKKYALLQTPVFVEEFILDRTLDPAIDEFGLDEVRLIDPTCGSGHFLLGTFARLFDLWIKREDNEIVAAQKALDGVWGVDINPFAVAIARFRLIVAALSACGIKRLKNAPAWNIHLATGDSLLFGTRWDREGNKKSEQQFLGTEEENWAPEIYACEDKEAISEVLGQQYHAVVGNPPYITVKDKRLNRAYRERYSTCHRKYSLGVPFTERFYDICLDESDGASGFIGMITTNAFMKREFGKKLITEYLPKHDLTHVVDTSGAYLPGHGTPTVILVGRNRLPVGDTIRAVLGIRGEPQTPSSPAQGYVWRSIVRNIDRAGAEDEFTSCADVPRSRLSSHPWSLQGGGAAELKEKIEAGRRLLKSEVSSIGFFSIPGDEDVFITERLKSWSRQGISITRPMVTGEGVRDWHITPTEECIYPYNEQGEFHSSDCADRHFWNYRSILRKSLYFGKTREQRGLDWREFAILLTSKMYTSKAITVTKVATHNHFVFDRCMTLFDGHSPIIKLPSEATEDDHLYLIGLLNSSTACFWMQQTFHNKGGPGGGSSKDEKWHDFYELSGTALQGFPLADRESLELARKLDELGGQYSENLPHALLSEKTPRLDILENAAQRLYRIRAQMIALQEELDWFSYKAYGVVDDNLVYQGDDLPGIALGQRAFEIVLARQLRDGTSSTKWFEWLNIQPTTDCPSDWPVAYRNLIERRMAFIAANRDIALIERTDCKRRWKSESWDSLQEESLREWLLDRLESKAYRPNLTNREPSFQSVAELSDKAGGDVDFLQVAAIYRGRDDFDVSTLVAELVETESVPFLPKMRYKPSGLRKRQIWENTWSIQRAEDSGDDVGKIKSPPKYAASDFLRTSFWRLRGRLDVPRERWISFPHCETESDPSLVVGWAGWNHLQQATALIAYYDARKREGWDAKRLTPLLAGLDQLLPWIHQWHPEVDPEFGETAGQSFQTMLEADAHELGLTLEDIRAWEPPAKTKTRRKRKTK